MYVFDDSKHGVNKIKPIEYENSFERFNIVSS